MSNQPEWQFVANLGDAHPLTYGGYFVYRDASGVYPPEAEVIQEPPDGVELDSPKARWTVYRFSCDPCTYSNGVLSDNRFHPDHPAWFADSLESVAESHGWQSADELRADLCSDDPIRLATAYREIGEYHGFHEFDQYSLTLDREEMAERYPQHARELPEPEPMFSVIEYSSFFAVRHNPTGEEYPMGDGVDTLFNEDCHPLMPGTPGFTEEWEASLNATPDETMEAYFPDLIDDED